MEVLVSRGHSLPALLHDYPIDLVLNLHRAAMENRYEEVKAGLKMQAIALNIAVINALDVTLGNGKGKVLESWLMAVDGPQDGQEAPARKSYIPPGTRKFFEGAPVIVKAKG